MERYLRNSPHVDKRGNTAIFAHCTLPTKLAESYEITSHFETGLSIGICGTLKQLDVTVFKVFGDDLTQYWVSEGRIIEDLVNETGCRTRVRVTLTEDVDYFLERSLANHHLVSPVNMQIKFVDSSPLCRMLMESLHRGHYHSKRHRCQYPDLLRSYKNGRASPID